MKLMIDIPDDMIKSIEQGSFGAKYNTYDIVGCLMNGTPLPDGAEILTKEAYSDLCTRAADVPDTNVGDLPSARPETHEKRTKTHACDCISRQAAIDTIGNVPDHDDGMVWEALSHAQRDVALLPSVEPERKIGRWEWVQYDSNPNIGNWHCTECRNIVIKGVKKEKKGAVFPLYTHCPNCGAKMEVNG